MATPTKIARRWFNEVWNDRREATIDELMAEDIVGYMEGGDVHRPADFKNARTLLLDAFPDLAITVEDTIEEGKKVVIRWSVTATHCGAGLGIAPTNRKVAFRGMTWLELRDDKIVRGWDSWNLGALLQTLKEPS